MASSRRRPRSNSSGPERRSSRAIPLRRSVTHGSKDTPTLYVMEQDPYDFGPSPLQTKNHRLSPHTGYGEPGIRQFQFAPLDIASDSRLLAQDFGFYSAVDPNSHTPRFPGVQPFLHQPQYVVDDIDSGVDELSDVDINDNIPSRTRTIPQSPLAKSSILSDTPSKFTQKWPPLRGLDNSVKSAGSRVLDGDGEPPAPAPSLEEGRPRVIPHLRPTNWTVHKWFLMLSVLTLLLYALSGLVYAVMTWFNAWDKAVVMTVADMDILTVITLTAALMLFSSIVGITGTLLDSRAIVAVYALLLWPCLICLLSVGYVSYKRVTFSLDHKLNFSWSRYYTHLGRLSIQDSLGCCGFYGALHDVAPSMRCYLRTALPGCKAMLYDFESKNLRVIWKGAFALVPVHLTNVIISLLCANHITRRFGKGMTPRQYRLSALDVKEDAHRILGSFKGRHIEEVGYAEI